MNSHQISRNLSITFVVLIVSLFAIVIIGQPFSELAQAEKFFSNFLFFSVVLIAAEFFIKLFKRDSFLPNEVLAPAARVIFFIGVSLCLQFVYLHMLWTQEASYYSVINGTLQWSDSVSYVRGGLVLIEKGRELEAWTCRRPINHLIWGTIFTFTQQNVALAIVLMTTIIAILSGLVSYFISKLWGIGAGLLFLLISYYFAKAIFTGTTLSENTGFIFGMVSLLFFLFWATSSKRIFLYFGFTLLTMGLVARAGCFFVLPFFALAIPFVEERRWSWSTFATLVGGIITGYLANKMVLVTLCDPNGVANANFAHTLYGVVTGGRSGNSADADFRAIIQSGINESAVAREIYKVCWVKFKENPFNFLIGLKIGWDQYWTYFMNILPKSFRAFETAAVITSVICGFLSLLSSNRTTRKLGAIVSMGALGIALSSTMLAVDGGSRVFATTIPLYSFIVVFAVPFAYQLKNQAQLGQITMSSKYLRKFAWLFVGFLLFLIYYSPLFSGYSKTKLEPALSASFECGKNEQKVVARYNHGLQIILDTTLKQPWTVTPEVFRRSVEIAHTEDRNFLGSLQPPKTITFSIDLLGLGSFFLVFDEKVDLPHGTLMRICTSGVYPGSVGYFTQARLVH